MKKPIPTWKIKIKRYSINDRMFWYLTNDGGFSWRKISTVEAMRIIDSQNGVIIG